MWNVPECGFKCLPSALPSLILQRFFTLLLCVDCVSHTSSRVGSLRDLSSGPCSSHYSSFSDRLITFQSSHWNVHELSWLPRLLLLLLLLVLRLLRPAVEEVLYFIYSSKILKRSFTKLWTFFDWSWLKIEVKVLNMSKEKMLCIFLNYWNKT